MCRSRKVSHRKQEANEIVTEILINAWNRLFIIPHFHIFAYLKGILQDRHFANVISLSSKLTFNLAAFHLDSHAFTKKPHPEIFACLISVSLCKLFNDFLAPFFTKNSSQLPVPDRATRTSIFIKWRERQRRAEICVVIVFLEKKPKLFLFQKIGAMGAISLSQAATQSLNPNNQIGINKANCWSLDISSDHPKTPPQSDMKN